MPHLGSSQLRQARIEVQAEEGVVAVLRVMHSHDSLGCGPVLHLITNITRSTVEEAGRVSGAGAVELCRIYVKSDTRRSSGALPSSEVGLVRGCGHRCSAESPFASYRYGELARIRRDRTKRWAVMLLLALLGYARRQQK